MATIRQHRPSYFTGFDNETVTFETVEQMLQIPFVAAFRNLPNGKVDPDFLHFSWTRHGGSEFAVLAEFMHEKRHTWWVVGFVDEPEVLQTLPKWTGG